MHEIITIFSQKELTFYYASSSSGVTATVRRKLWATTTLAFLVGRITAKQKSSASQLLLGVLSASVWPSHCWETHKYNYWSIIMTSQLSLRYPKLHLASMQKWLVCSCLHAIFPACCCNCRNWLLSPLGSTRWSSDRGSCTSVQNLPSDTPKGTNTQTLISCYSQPVWTRSWQMVVRTMGQIVRIHCNSQQTVSSGKVPAKAMAPQTLLHAAH